MELERIKEDFETLGQGVIKYGETIKRIDELSQEELDRLCDGVIRDFQAYRMIFSGIKEFGFKNTKEADGQ